MKQKQVVVIAGPAGSGKNSVISEIITRCSHCERLVTATTRIPRDGEVNGVDYHFLTLEEFNNALDKGNILEHRYVKTLDTHYGVYKPDLESRLALGEIIIAQLDIIGARYLKENYEATTFFILPDFFERLEERVRGRNKTMSDDEVGKRMDIARIEIAEHAPQYDYQIVNENGKLDEAVLKIMEILGKEGYTL